MYACEYCVNKVDYFITCLITRECLTTAAWTPLGFRVMFSIPPPKEQYLSLLAYLFVWSRHKRSVHFIRLWYFLLEQSCILTVYWLNTFMEVKCFCRVVWHFTQSSVQFNPDVFTMRSCQNLLAQKKTVSLFSPWSSIIILAGLLCQG